MEKIFFSFLICFISTIIIYIAAKKTQLFKYSPNQTHKERFKNNILIVGGPIIFINIVTLFFLKTSEFDYSFLIFFSSIFIIGLGSDLFNLSAKLRLFLIFLISFFLLIHVKIYVWDFQFNILNDFIKDNYLAGVIFSAFCLATFINGMNFIDGSHGLVIIFNLLVILFLNFFLENVLKVEVDALDLINYLIPILFILLYLNISERVFLGDSGSYIIAAMIGYFVLILSQNKITSYPYVYANLLIYPAFEVFFSIFRKIISNNNPLNPDKNHFHQILERIFKKKYYLNHSKSKIYVSLIINFFVFIFFTNTIVFYDQKWILICNIFIFCITYILMYYKLCKIII